MPTPARRLALAASSILLALLAPPHLDAAPEGDPCPPAARRAGAVLDGTAEPSGLLVAAAYVLDEALLDAGVLRANLATEIGSSPGPALASVCVGVVVETETGIRPVASGRLYAPQGETRELFRWGGAIDLPADASQVLVVAEDPASGRWGVAVAEEEDAVQGPGPDAVTLKGGGWLELGPAAGASSLPAPQPAKPEVAGAVVRLVPPRDDPATGRTRFDALVTTDAVDRVVFFLDGEEAAKDGVRPYAAGLDLDSPAREQTVRVVAYDKGGAAVGEDTLVVNRRDDPFRVRIVAWSLDAATGRATLEASVTVPRGGKLRRVELFRNETRIGELAGPGYRLDFPLPEPRPEDYLRVAATLADGATIDDVVLLAAPGAVEEVEVTLVELHAVVSDAEGNAVSGLRPEDFALTVDGEPRAIESFAHADDVPLVLGLVIDTSGSMELLMADTKKAAAKFLGSTILAADRAFIVDFDQRPRLRQPLAGDLVTLLGSLGGLRAGGATALYDAVVFSMLQFETAPGRKALVVLSDGDDRDSTYGPKACVEHGQKLGVPVYVIGLGALDDQRRVYPKGELRRLTGETGGRLWFVDSFADLDGAYAQIRAELRSQYTLRFHNPRDLDARERRSVAVRVARPGLTARVVVGASRRD